MNKISIRYVRKLKSIEKYKVTKGIVHVEMTFLKRIFFSIYPSLERRKKKSSFIYLFLFKLL